MSIRSHGRPTLLFALTLAFAMGAASGALFPLHGGANAQVFVLANYRPNFGAYGNTITGYKREIQQAQAIGIDGFLLDMEGWGPGTAKWANFEQEAGYIFTAAADLGTGFKLAFDLDCQGYGYDTACETAAGQMLSAYAGNPNYFHYNGRPVFSGWRDTLSATGHSADDTFWTAVYHNIQATGTNPLFLPMFSDFLVANPINQSQTNRSVANWFAASWMSRIVQGLMQWSNYVPALDRENNDAFAAVMANNGLIAVPAVGSWWGQIRYLSLGHNGPNGYVESLEFNGGEGLSQVWEDIIKNLHSKIVYITTWNDYTESYMGPADRADLIANNLPAWQITGDYLYSHAAYTELNRYFIKWFKTGVQPTWPDAMYVFYRTAPMNTVATQAWPGTVISWNQQKINPTLDELYITTILTAPATLTVSSGGKVTNVDLSAGITHTRVPFTVGAQAFTLRRGVTTLIDITGANVVSTERYYYNINPVSYYGYYPGPPQ